MFINLKQIKLINMENSKRIKIERPEDLKEGMRVEFEYESEKWNGIIFKSGYFLRVYATNQKDKTHIMEFGIWNIFSKKCTSYGEKITSIHRLIDGIEDVVVGDILIKKSCGFCRVLDVRKDLIDRSHFNYNLSNEVLNYHQTTETFWSIKKQGWEIYIYGEKTEFTDAEGRKIIEVKGVKLEDIVIKKDE